MIRLHLVLFTIDGHQSVNAFLSLKTARANYAHLMTDKQLSRVVLHTIILDAEVDE